MHGQFAADVAAARHILLGLMATHATPEFAWLELDVAAHPPDFHQLFVQRLEGNGQACGHLEIGRSILLHGNRADDSGR